MVLIVRFAVAPRKQADDFGACVVDAPQGGDAGFDLGLHVLDRAEVAALEDGCAELVGFEEIPESFEESLRVGFGDTEKNIGCRIFELGVGMDGEVAFLERCEDDEMTALDYLRVDLQDMESCIIRQSAERSNGHLHVRQLVFFAVV